MKFFKSIFNKKTLKIFISLIILFSICLYFANRTIKLKSNPFLFNEIDKVKPLKTGLVLGTSKHLGNGSINPFYQNRLIAAKNLYFQNKIKQLIVSGDNSSKYYNEPQDMKDDLIKMGVPDSVIFLDYAGFRTFDSMVRLKAIFNQDSAIVISQQFHNERAIFIAQQKNIFVYGYCAKDVSQSIGFKTYLREYFARLKVFVDLLFNKQPKFYGPKIKMIY